MPPLKRHRRDTFPRVGLQQETVTWNEDRLTQWGQRQDLSIKPETRKGKDHPNRNSSSTMFPSNHGFVSSVRGRMIIDQTTITALESVLLLVMLDLLLKTSKFWNFWGSDWRERIFKRSETENRTKRQFPLGPIDKDVVKKKKKKKKKKNLAEAEKFDRQQQDCSCVASSTSDIFPLTSSSEEAMDNSFKPGISLKRTLQSFKSPKIFYGTY